MVNGVFAVTFPRFMAIIFELSFVGKDFRELVASLTANKFFAGASNFRETYKCVMTACLEKLRSETIFVGNFSVTLTLWQLYVTRNI